MISDVEILELIKNGEIQLKDPEGNDVIVPSTGVERDVGQLQSIGYNLRADQLYSFDKRRWVKLDTVSQYVLRPGEFAIIGTYERVRLGTKVGATIHSMARETLVGLAHVSTTIHPGWALNEPSPAYLQVAVKNQSPMPLKISHKQPFCRVLFSKLTVTPSLPAPSLSDVKKDFARMEKEANEHGGRKARLTGWIGLVGMIVLSVLILFGVSTMLPDLAPAAIALVVVLLTTGISWIRNRYRIV
ncbi:MAG TPA: hypothetical protein VL334_10075 [Anaerolineae bacterium]|nr:hypothetical protein [Anaerolineae bacterium]